MDLSSVDDKIAIKKISLLQNKPKPLLKPSDTVVEKRNNYRLMSNFNTKIKTSSTNLQKLENNIDLQKEYQNQLKKEIIEKESEYIPQGTDKKSLLLEKDELKEEINTLSKHVLETTEELNYLEAHYQTLNDENENLLSELNKLRNEEDKYDSVKL